MNAVEIEQAIIDLAEQPFDPAEFPYAFLEAFGNKATTIKRPRAGASNKSDLGGVLQTSNIHILNCGAGQVTQRLTALKVSPATAKPKARFILATDGAEFKAEDLTSGETVACYTERFVEAGIEPSVGSVDDSALAESINGLYKTEVIERRSWPILQAVEMATLDWVDWYNHKRLLGPIGHVPPSGGRSGLLLATGGSGRGGLTQTKQPPGFPGRFKKLTLEAKLLPDPDGCSCALMF